MSIYMLTYVDDIKVQRIVQRALNRGESFHQLRSAIMRMGGKQIQGRTDLELAISNECNRLLANCIIYYNCVLLSSILESIDQKKDPALYKLITRLSPVAWHHINMIGTFEFLQNKETVDIKSVVEELMKNLNQKAK
jgi:hypothetical protein